MPEEQLVFFVHGLRKAARLTAKVPDIDVVQPPVLPIAVTVKLKLPVAAGVPETVRVLPLVE
jgi:hypothetical protein